MWLQSSVNALYECGLKNDMLSLMYLQNRNIQVALKVNGELTRRTDVQDVIMQGTVWSSLMCTSSLDRLNKIILSEEELQYHYKGDKNVPIGIRGMVDDTLGVSKCGSTSVHLNSIINSFIESQRLTLSGEKSVVIHVGKKSKCHTSCPDLKVHNNKMHEADSVRYLGNIITPNGGISDTIEDRRNKGWGKVAVIKGILSEVDMGRRRIEVGLLLRKSLLVNSLLFTTETWSGVKESDIRRLELVDLALLRSLLDCHSKVASEFVYMETGSLMLRHILSMNRMMYHHHLLTLEDGETLKNIYDKQKSQPTKGDWYELLLKDFTFIGEDLNEEVIKSYSKTEYKKKVKAAIEKAAFKYFLEQKTKHTKLDNIQYTTLQTQPYLCNSEFTKEERKLLVSLRSRCHSAKMNFKRLHKNDLKCRLGCDIFEDQIHIFTQCKYSADGPKNVVEYEDLFKDSMKQKKVIEAFLKIEQKRDSIKYNNPPGELVARARAQ